MLVTVLVLAFGQLCQRLGLLVNVEHAAIDTRMRLNAPRPEPEVVLIRLTEDDYDSELFNPKSSQYPSGLKLLIEKVSKAIPSVVGVDVNTSAVAFNGLAQQLGIGVGQKLPRCPPIVWAQDAKLQNGYLTPLPVLGGNSASATTGLVIMREDDDDNVLRHYQRAYDIKNGSADSFPWKIVKERMTSPCSNDQPGKGKQDFAKLEKARDTNKPLAIRLALEDGTSGRSRRLNLSALQFMHLKDAAALDLLHSSIVLIGSDYREARDEHVTPVGILHGVDILAQTIETELQDHGGIPEPRLSAVLVILAFENIVLVYLFHVIKSLPRAFFLSIVSVSLAATLCSRLGFGTWRLWAYFLPIMGAVMILELYYIAVHHRVEVSAEVLKGRRQ